MKGLVVPLLLGAAVWLTGCGSTSSTAPEGTASTPRVPLLGQTPAPIARDHGSPRWVPTATLSGQGMGRSAPFGIIPDVLQWRVHYHCDSGSISIATDPPPLSGRPLVTTTACPASGDAYATRAGQIRLVVETPGAWTAAVEQEIDTPLDEPPLPQMQAPGAAVLLKGVFRNVDRQGHGNATVYRLPDGSLAIRLDTFEIPINTDLYVWAEPVAGLTSSTQMNAAAHTTVAPLKSTSGNQNYAVPAEVKADQIRSIVIWCLVQQFAYVATDLQPAG